MDLIVALATLAYFLYAGSFYLRKILNASAHAAKMEQANTDQARIFKAMAARRYYSSN